MKGRRNIWISLSCVVLILGAFGYGYYTSLGKNNEEPKQKPGTLVDSSDFTPYIPEEAVDKIPQEDRVTPSTILEKRIVSVNTGNYVIEYNEKVPEILVNMAEDEVKDYFKYYGRVEFSREKITVTRELPNLPDRYVVKLENKHIVVYKTDSDGNATRYDDFEPIPQKNMDANLERGIEVDSIDDVWDKIQDYE